MESLKRNCMRVLGQRQHKNNGIGSYKILSSSDNNDEETMLDKRIRKLEKKQRENKSKKVPKGCFCVYVGPERQRFVIKIKVANHPFFVMLLEDVESKYGFGYNNNGPIWLPCNVEFFCKILAEIDMA